MRNRPSPPRSSHESRVSKHGIFQHRVENNYEGAKQEVKVEVNIDQKDDCLTSCFSALGACFGKAAKS